MYKLLLGLILFLIPSLPQASAQEYCEQWLLDGSDAILVPCSQLDSDWDGIRDFFDNCPFVPNPNQADGWGTGAGDACDTSYVSNGDGVTAFIQFDGSIDVYGRCGINRTTGEVQCRKLGTIDVCAVDGMAVNESRFAPPEGDDPYTMQVLVTLLSVDPWVIQINVLNSNGSNGYRPFEMTIDNLPPNCSGTAAGVLPTLPQENTVEAFVTYIEAMRSRIEQGNLTRTEVEYMMLEGHQLKARLDRINTATNAQIERISSMLNSYMNTLTILARAF